MENEWLGSLLITQITKGSSRTLRHSGGKACGSFCFLLKYTDNFAGIDQNFI